MENVSSNYNTCISKISVLEEKESNENEIRINDFYDNDHLNLQGAKKFSSIINTEILK